MSQQEITLDESAPVVVAKAQSLGEWLIAARQAKGMSAQDVASRTNRSLQQIMAVEADDYSNVNAPVLLRAIARQYAKAVGVDPEEAVAHLPTEYQQVTASVPMRDAQFNRVFTHSGTPLKSPWISRTALVVLAAVALGLLAYWIFGSRFNKPVDGAKKISEPNQVQVITPPAAVVVAPTPDTATQTGATETVPVTTPTPLATSGNDLVLKFKGASSWVEIRDAKGAKLLSGTFEAGSEQTVSGDTPLSLIIGNATDVEMQWKGQPYDLKSAMGKGTTAKIKDLN